MWLPDTCLAVYNLLRSTEDDSESALTLRHSSASLGILNDGLALNTCNLYGPEILMIATTKQWQGVAQMPAVW